MVIARIRSPWKNAAMLIRKKYHVLQLLPVLLLFAAIGGAQTMRSEAEKNFARDIYKQFVEIQSGYTSGATTPVAEAAAVLLKAAGFPDSDIFVAGANPKKAH